MLLDQVLNFEALVTVDVGIFVMLMAGVLRARRYRAVSTDSSQAFSILEASIGRTLTDLPPGYTLREIVDKVRKIGVKVDWSKVEEALKQYEDWRYGGAEKKSTENGEVIKLARAVTRRRRWLPI